jgi:hypothetical protein
MADQILTQDYLKQLFDYKDGYLYWKVDRGNNRLIGKKAGVKTKTGYRKICVNSTRHPAHRLIFLYHHGYLPFEVDHIEGLSNCIENLRAATHAENMRNCKISKDNTSGFKNVSWHKASQKWRVTVQINNKPLNLGVFNDIELADLVAQEARDKYHGKFARHF